LIFGYEQRLWILEAEQVQSTSNHSHVR